MAYPGSKICKVIIKKYDPPRRCKAPALKGMDVCLAHGGRIAKLQFKHGLYGKYMPSKLRDLVDEQRLNPRLMDLREQVAVASGMLAYVFEQSQTRIDMERDKDKKVLTESEITGITTMCEKISVLIERTARVGLAVKMMVHVEAVERMAELWIEAFAPYIPAGHRKQFADKLSLLSAQAINQSGTKTIRGIISSSENKEYQNE